MPTKVSIVIVSWNAKVFLMECLKSLLNMVGETQGQPEMVVVDNASDDGTVPALRQYGSAIKIIQNKENVGFATGNNVGILSTTGEYVALINPDVIVGPDCIAKLCTYMDEHPDVGLTGPKVFNPDGTLQHSYWKTPTLFDRLMRALRIHSLSSVEVHNETGTPLDKGDKAVGVLSGCFWVVRRRALSDVGLLDEGFFMYAEDTDWCRRFWQAGWKVTYVPTATAIHHGGGSSARMPVKSYVEMHRANLRYWRKHHGLLGQVGVYLIMLLHQILRIVAGSALFITSHSRREAVRPIVRRSVACLHYLCSGSPPHIVSSPFQRGK